MLGKDALCRNRKRDLRQFLQRFCPGLDKTRAKFFRQSLWGILNSGSLTVSKWLRWIPDSCKQIFYRHKRLLNQLRSKDWNHAAVLESYQRQWAQMIQADTPLIIDLTDLPRPRGKKMPYIRLVRDGSEDRLHYGYWCVEIYAYWGKGRITPLLLHPYSTEAPDVLGENAQILASVDRVLAATSGQGVLVMDRGADRDHLLIPWIDDRRRFVIRLRGDRHLLLDNGALIPAATLAEQLLQKARDGKRAWCRVYLPERPEQALYLVAKTLPGRDKPLILLTSLTAQDLNTAKNVLSYYRRRWKCEEAARFLKTDLGIERFALRLYESFPRLFLLACLAMSFLTWLALRFDSLSQRLCAKAPGRHPIKFLYYRLLDWLRNQFQHGPLEAEPP
jgi:hypothetical protein